MTPEERMRLLRNEDEWTFTLARRASPFPARRRFSPVLVSLATIAAVAIVGVIVFSVFGLGIRSARPVAPPVVPTQSASPTPSSTPRPTDTPTATPTFERSDAVAPPASRFAFGCSDLASDAQVSDLMGTAVHAVDGVASPLSAFWTVPREGAVAQVGGLVCEWNNGVPYNSIGGSDDDGPEHIGFQILLVPDAAGGWKKSAESVTGAYVGCANSGCNSTSLLGTTWMQTSAMGVTDVDRTKADRRATFRALEKAIEKVVKDAPTPGAGAPSTSTIVPSRCSAYVTDARVSAAAGATISAFTYGDEGGGGWSVEAEALERSGLISCLWATKEGNNMVSLKVMPHGAWLPTDYASLVAPQGAASVLRLSGLASTDSAWIRCDMRGSAPDDYCTLDLAIGGNWIELALYPKQGGWDHPERPLAEVLTDVANDVVASLK